jgi:hypothetical protein
MKKHKGILSIYSSKRVLDFGVCQVLLEFEHEVIKTFFNSKKKLRYL